MTDKGGPKHPKPSPGEIADAACLRSLVLAKRCRASPAMLTGHAADFADAGLLLEFADCIVGGGDPPAAAAPCQSDSVRKPPGA